MSKPTTSELHIPPEVADAMRALRPELRAKLSLRDVDDMTKPLRKRIAELESECAQWQEASGQAQVRAEEADDRVEKLERKLDAARVAYGEYVFGPVERKQNAWAALDAALTEDKP